MRSLHFYLTNLKVLTLNALKDISELNCAEGNYSINISSKTLKEIEKCFDILIDKLLCWFLNSVQQTTSVVHSFVLACVLLQELPTQ